MKAKTTLMTLLAGLILDLTPTLLAANENNQNREARWETYGRVENNTHFSPTKIKDGWLPDTTVYGSLEMKNVTVQGRLTVNGLTEIKDSEIKKNLMTYGTLMARDLFIMGDISVQGKTKIKETTISESLDSKGKTYLDEISIAKDLNVFGPLDTEKITAQGTLTVQGNTECKDATFQRPVTVNGLLQVKDYMFQSSLRTKAELLDLYNCQTKNITIADNDSGKPQVFKIKGNSFIRGDITFTNKAGGNVIELGRNAQLSGKAINDEIQKN